MATTTMDSQQLDSQQLDSQQLENGSKGAASLGRRPAQTTAPAPKRAKVIEDAQPQLRMAGPPDPRPAGTASTSYHVAHAAPSAQTQTHGVHGMQGTAAEPPAPHAPLATHPPKHGLGMLAAELMGTAQAGEGSLGGHAGAEAGSGSGRQETGVPIHVAEGLRAAAGGGGGAGQPALAGKESGAQQGAGAGGAPFTEGQQMPAGVVVTRPAPLLPPLQLRRRSPPPADAAPAAPAPAAPTPASNDPLAGLPASLSLLLTQPGLAPGSAGGADILPGLNAASIAMLLAAPGSAPPPSLANGDILASLNQASLSLLLSQAGIGLAAGPAPSSGAAATQGAPGSSSAHVAIPPAIQTALEAPAPSTTDLLSFMLMLTSPSSLAGHPSTHAAPAPGLLWGPTNGSFLPAAADNGNQLNGSFLAGPSSSQTDNSLLNASFLAAASQDSSGGLLSASLMQQMAASLGIMPGPMRAGGALGGGAGDDGEEEMEGEVEVGGAGTRTRGSQGSAVLESDTKVTFSEPVKLGDGRIYMPLPFVHKNFAGQEFPVHLIAQVVVDGQVIKTNCPVKIARSQNKSRRHGLGNHWVSGHQRFIKALRDPRLRCLEIPSPGHLIITLSSLGTWEALPRLPSASSSHGGNGNGMMMNGGGGAEGLGGLAGQAEATAREATEAAARPLGALGMLGGAGGGGGGAFAQANALDKLLGVDLSMQLLQQCLGSAARTAPAPSQPQPQASQSPAGQPALPAAAGAAALPDYSAANAAAAAVLAGAAPEQLGGADGPQGGVAAGGEAATGGEAAGEAGLAAPPALSFPLLTTVLPHDAQGGADNDAGTGLLRLLARSGLPPAPVSPADGPGSAGPSGSGSATLQGLSLDAAAQLLLLTSTPQATLQQQSPLNQQQQQLQQAQQQQDQGVQLAALQLAQLLQLASMPLAGAAPPHDQGQQAVQGQGQLLQGQIQGVQGLLHSGDGGAGQGDGGWGGAVVGGHGGADGSHAVPPGVLGGQASTLPRLYDGRIHVPLSIIQAHYDGMDFPTPVAITVYMDTACVGERLSARIVRYKKHKRPNHFNFWITGLQKTLAPYNDVRQAGVTWEPRSGLTVHLLSGG